MLAVGQSTPAPYGDILEQTAQTRGREVGNETALIKLAELKRSQASEEEMMAAIMKDENLRRLFFGDSVMGGIGTAPGGPGGAPGGPPAPAPMTQQSLTPGQPPGAPQMVPGGQDPLRYAGVSPQGGGPIPADVMAQTMPTVTPPQGQPGVPTLATIGPPGGMPGPQQGQMQAPRNPVMEMARRDPRAAMMLQQQIQGQQDAALKRDEQRLKIGEVTLGYVGQQAQGVTNQASLDTMRSDLQSQGLHQYAAQLPQFYSKEAMQPFIEKAQSVKDSLTQRLEARKLDVLLRGQDVELAKAQQTGGKVNYQVDAQGNIVVVPEYAPGGGPVQSRPVLGADGQPIKSLEGQKLTTQQQEQLRTTETGLRTQLQARLAPFYEVRDAIGRIEASAETPSASGDLALITAFMKMLDPSTGVRDVEFRNAATAGGFLEQVKARLGYVQNGERLSDPMRADLLERSRKLFAQYGKDYGQVRQQFRDLSTRLGGNSENVDLEMGSTAAKPPGGGAGTATATTNTFTDADIAATLANPKNKGKTRQQVIDAALAKGLKYQ